VLIAGTVEFVLSLVGVAAGLVAVAIGVVGIWTGLIGSRAQITTVEGVNAELKKILSELQGELETHYIGKFPDFMPNIVDVIQGATKELTIFCDLPAYGVVSNPLWHIKYREALQLKLEDQAVKVRILHLDRPARRALLQAQFGDIWHSNPKVKAFLERYDRDVRVVTKEEFMDLVEGEQRKALDAYRIVRTRRDVTTTETNAIMPMYFWIADRHQAVFALTQFERGAHEVAFRTTSENLTKAMGGIYKRYLAEAQRASGLAASGAELVADGPAAGDRQTVVAAGSAAGGGETVEQREQQTPGAEHR
jgi:hypothetical protein